MRTWRTFSQSLLCFLALAAVTACGKAPVREVGEFESYVESFETAAAARGIPLKVDNLVIQLGQLSNPMERGVCEIGGDKVPTITIDPDAWAASSDAEREELVFHEMGHCVLRRDHDKKTDATGQPTSLMYPLKIGTAAYLKHQNEYLDELFSSPDHF